MLSQTVPSMTESQWSWSNSLEIEGKAQNCLWSCDMWLVTCLILLGNEVESLSIPPVDSSPLPSSLHSSMHNTWLTALIKSRIFRGKFSIFTWVTLFLQCFVWSMFKDFFNETGARNKEIGGCVCTNCHSGAISYTQLLIYTFQVILCLWCVCVCVKPMRSGEKPWSGWVRDALW